MGISIKPKQKIKYRIRKKISGTAERPRLSIFRSNKNIYAQVIDDAANKVVCGTSNLKGKSGIAGATEVGKSIATMAKKAKIESVSFDRNGLRYHGQIKALAEAAREAGLKF